MTFPSQFPDLLTLAERDGEGGWKAEPFSIIRGERSSFVLNLPEHPVYDDWTGGDFTAVLRAAPGASGDPLAEYTCATGTPAAGSTPITFDLLPAAQSGLPAVAPGTGLAEVFLAVHFTPDGGSKDTLITTRILIRGAI
jgi:hypothetical protein